MDISKVDTVRLKRIRNGWGASSLADRAILRCFGVNTCFWSSYETALEEIGAAGLWLETLGELEEIEP